MHVERLELENFRCFGPQPTQVVLGPDLVAFVGDNGTGKTALMQALQRMFGVTSEQRRLRKQDFHVPFDEVDRPVARALAIEAIIAFPELDTDDENPAVPAFFRNMAAEENGNLKVRLRLQAPGRGLRISIMGWLLLAGAVHRAGHRPARLRPGRASPWPGGDSGRRDR